MSVLIAQADATHLPLDSGSVDLICGSPPYCDARTYGIGAQRGCEAWAEWMMAVTREAVRVSSGLVLWAVAGVTRKHRYWPGPEMLLADWWRAGGECWRPAYWNRIGIPGSGGRQWLRADVEYILAFKGKPGPIAWADNTACGHPPKWGPGGEMSNRVSSGGRVNQWGKNGLPRGMGNKRADGTIDSAVRPSNVVGPFGNQPSQVLANPGNLIRTNAGGGHMGSKLAHENEAPFPEKLVEFFIESYCKPGGIVLDPFSGSGTTVTVARRLERNGLGFDLRFNQCELGRRRLAEKTVAHKPRRIELPHEEATLFSESS